MAVRLSWQTKQHRDRIFEVCALMLVLGLAAYLRLANLAQNPGWYSDEGTILNISQNLEVGRIQYLAILDSTLLAARLPLFPLILTGFSRILGPGILTLRLLSALCGVASVGLLYVFVRRAQRDEGPLLALVAAFVLGIYPQAVLYNRLGLSYNLIAPLVLLVAIGLWGYLEASNQPASRRSGRRSNKERRWLALAALAIGIGLLSDLVMLLFLMPFGITVVYRNWRDLLWSLPLALAPFTIFAMINIILIPGALLFDLRHMFWSLGENNSLLSQFPAAVLNYIRLLLWDIWWPLALVGWFFLKPARLLRLVLLMVILPIFAILRTASVTGLGYYYVIPFMSFVALGIAALVRYGLPKVYEFVVAASGAYFRMVIPLDRLSARRERVAQIVNWGTGLVVVAFVMLPVFFYLFLSATQTQFGFHSALDPYLIDPGTAQEVADFVNRQVSPTDLVISSPTTAWLFQSRVADFQLVLASRGVRTLHYPPDIPPERFAFEVDPDNASFVVIDNLSRNWTAQNIPEVAALIAEIEQWPLVKVAGEIQVYQNPGS